jgi:integrase
MKIVDELKARKLIDCTIAKAGKGAKVFVEFLEEFWDYTSSPYVKDRLATKDDSIHKRHCYEMLRRVESFYVPYFKDKPLYSINKQDLKDFKIFLAGPREKPEGYKGHFAEKLSASYRTKILVAAKTALKWAFNEGLINTDPSAGIKKITGEAKKRGLLTEAEVVKIFHSVKWNDNRAYVGNFLACTTGMRAGEVLALRKSDIDNMKGSWLFIVNSWSTMDKLKCPKTNKERKVFLYPEVKAKLLELLTENPHTDPDNDPFIFYSLYPRSTSGRKNFTKGFVWRLHRCQNKL